MYESYRYWINLFVKYFKRMALQKRITPKQIARLPLKFYEGEVVVVQDAETAESAVAELLSESVLGFDIESKPAFTKGESYAPSLMQLAGKGKVYLFKLGKIGGIDPLKKILENCNIVKVGVAVNNDIQNLFKAWKFTPGGFHDLGTFSKKLRIIHTGLRNLAAIFLRVRVSKKSQLTDWSQENLTQQQISYAATDAWISREIFFKMAQYF
jgi:ribonuclease D